MPAPMSGPQPQQVPASNQQWTAEQIAQWHAQQQAVAAAAQRQMTAAGLVQPNVQLVQPAVQMPAPQVLQTQAPLLPGIVVASGNDNMSPMLGLAAYEKQGKSTTAITTLVGWPDQNKEPLCIAWDPHGPDACVRLGYRPHVIRVRDQPGEAWIDKHRYAMRTLRTNLDAVHRRYGSVVVDCASTCAMALHTDAQKLPKNANNSDTRAPYVEATLWLKEVINAIIDIGLPNIWLSWLQEGSVESEKVEGAQNRKVQRLGGPDIMGSKMRNFIAGKSHHNFLLEKYKVQKGGTDPWGRPADDEGSVRVFHSKQWGLLNAGGRYSHVLPDPCPAHFGWILSKITGRGPFVGA